MTAILQTRALHKHFGGLSAVSDVNLEIAAGEIHCLIGPNGAGKSTLFKLVAGPYPPSGGEVMFRGENVTHRKPYERVERGMSIKLQVPSVFRELPVAQNLEISLQRKSLGRGDGTREASACSSSCSFRTTPAGRPESCSHGQQQWLEIGMALALQPALLLLDEPTAGMSPQETAAHRRPDQAS